MLRMLNLRTMNEVSLLVTLALACGGLLGCVPLLLLFIDYPKRKEIHKPFIYIAVFFFTLAIALPFLLKIFGFWLAMFAPFAVMGYVGIIALNKPRP